MARIGPAGIVRTLLLTGVLAVLLASGLSQAQATPARSAQQIATQTLSQARALEADWGRCPTARPANALLRRAARTRGAGARARIALKAVAAYEKVAAECIMPVDQPTIVVPPSEGPAPPVTG
jgi:hypothetical protein